MKLWQLARRVTSASLNNAASLYEFPPVLDTWIRATYASMREVTSFGGEEVSGSLILRRVVREGYCFCCAEVRHPALMRPLPAGSFPRTFLAMDVDASALRNRRFRMAERLLAVLLSVAALEKNRDPEAFVHEHLAYHINDEGVVVRYVGKRADPLLPEGISAIGDYAFLAAPIERICLPSSCTSIGNGAFYGCGRLAHVVLPKSLRTIGSDAFHSCGSLQTVKGPGAALTHVGANAFMGTPWLQRQSGFIELNHILLAYRGESETEFVVPEGIRAIADKAEFIFTNAEEGRDPAPAVERLILPDSMRELGAEVFSLPRLRYVDLGGTECIRDRCFMYCDDLFADDDVFLGNLFDDSIEDILTGEEDEKENDVCESLVVSNGRRVRFVGEDVFPEKVSFVSCSELLVGQGVKYVQKGRRFEVAEGSEAIENLIFKKSDTDVVYIPGSVEKIENCVFEDGVVIETPFYSPAQLFAEKHRIETHIRFGAIDRSIWAIVRGEYFLAEDLMKRRTYNMVTALVYSDHESNDLLDELSRKCPNLREFRLPVGTEESCCVVDGVLFSASYNERPTLMKFPPARKGIYSVPKGIDYIREYAFENALLSEVRLPEGLIWIDDMAFCGSHITHLDIPGTVVSIGDHSNENIAGGCDQLTSIRVLPDNPKYFTYDGVLFSAESGALLCYPAGKDETTYRIPDFCRNIGWQAFAGCRNLKEIVFPEEGEFYLSNYQFPGCTTLETLVLSDAVIEIEPSAFDGCTVLNHIYIGNGEMKIEMTDNGPAAFYPASR